MIAHGPTAASRAPTKDRTRTAPAAGARATTGRTVSRTTVKSRGDRAVLLLLGLAASAACSFDGTARAETATVISCEHEIALAARRYDIPLAVFYAVGLNETGAKGRLQPFSMNIDGRPTANASLDEALVRFRRAKAAGARMIDIGCMQINHHYHAAHFASLEAMFDPAQNIDYAARFLRELKGRERTWTMAVARYNAGPDNDPAQKKYVCGVLTKMVASGFGAWTESARKFCFSESVAKAPL